MWPALPLLLLGLLLPCTAGSPVYVVGYQQCNSSVEGTIYKYRAKTLNGSQTVNFSDYAGKAVLFVNVATY